MTAVCSPFTSMFWITSLGLVAAACTTVAFLPQVVKALRTRETKDISLLMFIILTTGLCLWLTYGLLVRDLPLILANCVTLILALIVLFLKVRYG